MPDIRPLVSPEEYRAAEQIQRIAWPSEDALEVLPYAFMLTTQKNGGLVLGAFQGDELLAFAFSFLGKSPQGQLKHCSHMLAVLPENRSAGLGEQLKWAQRDFVRKQGISLITWTVDPLEGPNASLNFGKLGVQCTRYLPNLYADMQDNLNKGLPSDRFEVDWQIDSDRVSAYQTDPQTAAKSLGQELAEAQSVNSFDWSEKFPRPDQAILDADTKSLALHIPPSIQAIKVYSMDLAKEWRLHTRSLFQNYFDKGYSAVGFQSRKSHNHRQNTYLLTKT